MTCSTQSTGSAGSTTRRRRCRTRINRRRCATWCTRLRRLRRRARRAARLASGRTARGVCRAFRLLGERERRCHPEGKGTHHQPQPDPLHIASRSGVIESGSSASAAACRARSRPSDRVRRADPA
jgi:hypothetical protein